MAVNLAAGAGSDTLVLYVTQNAHKGSAQYTVSVDGKQVGGTFTANAPQGSGQRDTLTLKGDWAAGSHRVDVKFLNDLWEPGVGDRNLYVEAATYNTVAVSGAKADLLSAGAKGFSFTDAGAPRPAPVSLSAGSGPDTLVLKVSQDAYQGSAQYTVSVDGKQVGGTFTASALKSSGQSDTLTLKGDWAAGAHNVEVRFLNDAWGGTAATDRNLYVDGATYNGAPVSGATKALMGAGPQSFAFTEAAPPSASSPVSLTAGSGSDSLVLKINQDAHQGSAQYTVSVDGAQVGGTFTASALKSSGQSDTLTLKGDWAAGPHSVQVTFLNDLYAPGVGDRNLYVSGATYNGAAVSGSSLEFLSGGPKGFSFTEGGGGGGGAAPAPTPAPAPAPAPNGGDHQFFSDASPWNTPVPDGARFQEVQGLDALMDRGAVGLASWDDGWASVGIWYADASDPLENIRWIPDSWSPVNTQGIKRTGNSASVEQSLLAQSKDINPYPVNTYSTQKANLGWNNGGAAPKDQYDEWVQTAPLRVHVPAEAAPAPDGDGHMVIIQPDGRALELYSPIRLSDGTLISQMFSFTDSEDGLGTGAANGRRAAMVPNYSGAITTEDVAKGEIDHALALLIPASMLTTAFTGPALAIDSNPNYSGTVPMGSRWAIPESVNINSLGLRTALGRMEAEAMQEHGAYVTDRGGGGVTIVSEYEPDGGPLSTYSWEHQQDLMAIFKAAQLVVPDGVTWA